MIQEEPVSKIMWEMAVGAGSNMSWKLVCCCQREANLYNMYESIELKQMLDKESAGVTANCQKSVD